MGMFFTRSLCCMLLLSPYILIVRSEFSFEDRCSTCECQCTEICRATRQIPEENIESPEDGLEENIENYEPVSRDTKYQYPPSRSRTPQLCQGCGRENLDLVNEFRARYGFQELRWDEGLAKMARKHSQEMYEHLSLEHSKNSAWENIAYSRGGTTWRGVAESMFEQWRKSQGHRRNMLTKQLRCAGIAIYGDGKTFYGTQIFLDSC